MEQFKFKEIRGKWIRWNFFTRTLREIPRGLVHPLPPLPPPTFCMKFPFRPVQQKGGRDREVVKTDGASDGFSPPVFVRERAGIVKRS